MKQQYKTDGTIKHWKKKIWVQRQWERGDVLTCEIDIYIYIEQMN